MEVIDAEPVAWRYYAETHKVVVNAVCYYASAYFQKNTQADAARHPGV